MDGITFLKKIMAEHPTPVVICSTFTEKIGRDESARTVSEVCVCILFDLPVPGWPVRFALIRAFWGVCRLLAKGGGRAILP